MLRRKGNKYPVKGVLAKTAEVFHGKYRSKRYLLDGDGVLFDSLRMVTFQKKGIKCCECGIEGAFFVKESTSKEEVYHLNLYALDVNGNEVLMTHDHIKPKCVGGKDHISNTQTMCEPCNQKKGAAWDSTKQVV